MSRDDIISSARGWLGTPYRHQASQKGIGTDCLGLLRGVWRECVGAEPLDVPPYTPDWADRRADDPLLSAAQTCLDEIAASEARSGDVLLFRMALGAPAKHCAILTATPPREPATIIHAYWGRSVTETRLVPWWSRRIAAAFRFPGVE